MTQPNTDGLRRRSTDEKDAKKIKLGDTYKAIDTKTNQLKYVLHENISLVML